MKFENMSAAARAKLEIFYSSFDMLIITGASSGIGRAFAQLVLKINPRTDIINLSRTEPDISSEKFIHLPCDLADMEELSARAEEALKLSEGKRVLLINNAGFGGYGLFPEPSNAHNDKMIDLNCRALTHLCGELLPEIKAQKGAIINVASTAAWQPCPYLNVYAATKAYVMSFTLALDYELRKSGAKALCLCPGPTSTNFFKAAGFTERPLPSNFGHKADDVALDALIALSKGKNLRVTGMFNSLSARMNYFVPRSLIAKISGSILSKIRSK